MTEKEGYAVIGNPIAHSKSPLIHTMFAQQTQQNIQYDARLFELDNFAEQARDFFSKGGLGLNVTVPFKEDAWVFANEHSERAKRAGAANTLKYQRDGRILADNTDGAGLIRDLTHNHNIELTHKRIVVLGAGGAVRGILQPLLAQQPASVLVANRTASKATELAHDFGDLGVIHGGGFESLQDAQWLGADVIINGTSASLHGQLPPLPDELISVHSCAYDMMYANEVTAFNAWAKAKGAAHAIDGLGMLVEQAAESFLLWRGVRPNTQEVMAALRER